MQRKIAAWVQEQDSLPKEVSLQKAAQLLHELAEDQIELAGKYEALRQEHRELVQVNEQSRREIDLRRQAEEALRTEARVLESMAEGVTVTGHRGNILYTNPAFDTMFGYEPGELVGRHSNILNYYRAEENTRVVKEILESVNTTGTWFGEFQNRKKDGAPFFTTARISVLTVAGKKLYISVQEDITARKRADKEIRRLASFPELNPNFVLEVDEAGRVIYANPAAQKAATELGLPGGVNAFLPPDLQEKFAAARQGGPRQYLFDLPLNDATYAVYLSFPHDLPTARLYGLNITERKKAEQALGDSREDLNRAQAVAHTGRWRLNVQRRVLTWSAETYRIFGIPQGTPLTYETFLSTVHPEDKEYVDRKWTAALKGKPYDIEHRIIAEGTAKWVRERAELEFDQEGRLLGGFGTVQDITERKRAEEALRRAHDELEERVAERTTSLRLANEHLLREIEERQEVEDRLRESEARFTAFMRHLPGPAVMRDIQGRYLFANEGWEKMTGKTRGEWQGKTLEDIWPLKMAKRFQQLDQEVLLEGAPLDSLETLELADGPHHFLIYRFPIRDRDGLPYMLGGMGIDITERMQAEEEAQKQTLLFEAFFDHAITPLVFLDPCFNFIRVNQAYARACHREASEFVGRNHFALYPSEAKQIFEEVVSSKTPHLAVAWPFEFPDQPERGVTYWDWSLAPILNEAGGVDFLVFSLKDVTEQVQTEEVRNRLIEILEATPDFVGTADTDRRLSYLNYAGRHILGIKEDEDIWRINIRDTHPQWAADLVFTEGLPTAAREGSWQGESALLSSDGREIPLSQVIVAHQDAAGQVQFFSTIARDISVLKQAQENIARQGEILGGINRILLEALACESGEDLGRVCLAVAEELTDSRFGFIDELNDQSTFDALAFSDPGWGQCRISAVTDLTHLKNIQPVGLLARSIREGKALIANEPASHPEAAGTPEGHPPLTAFLGMPLTSGGRTMGLLGLGNKAGGYTPADQEAVEILAPTIVEALMHHRTREDLKRSERKLRYLADQLLTAQENERKRLASELHDELGHALLSLKLNLRSIEKKMLPEQESIKKEIRDQLTHINGVIDEVRRLYHDLSPGNIEDLGLTKALSTLIEDFAAGQPHLTWKVDLPDLEGLFSPPVETIIYRLVQEALTNIGKHANPSSIIVSALREEQQVRLTIEDDGKGFKVAEVLEAQSEAQGLGLASMEERLNMVGGSFQVWSKEEEGTRLTFAIPTWPKGNGP
jgi:PAS domain S-box-containing protein